MRCLTLGTFDLLHPGHVHLLRQCRRLAGDHGEVIVGVNRDDFVERYKGHRPVMGEVERRFIVEQLPYVTRAIINTGDEYAGRIIEALGPGLLVIGADWRDRDYLGQLRVTVDDLDRWQILGPVYVPLLADHSSSRLRELASS